MFRCAIASPHEVATEAGAAAVRAGGNALDAALATAAALTGPYPHRCSIGCVLFARVAAPGGSVTAFGASGAAPAATDVQGLLNRHGSMPVGGVETVTVPGTVSGWEALASLGARRTLAEALEEAIGLARDGVSVAPSLANSIADHQSEIETDPGMNSIFVRDGSLLSAGETLSQPALARSLEAIAADGPSAFYRGGLGRDFAAGLASAGSAMTADDLAAHEPRFSEPLRGRFRGRDVMTSPPGSQGFAFLEILAALEVLELSPGSGEEGLLARVFRLASIDRDRYLADPAFAEPDLESLLSEAHAEAIAESARRGIEASPVPRERRPRPDGDTIAVVAVDSEGRAVSLIQSVFHAFGARILEPATGIVCQNRGACFSLDPDSPNLIAPGKRPAHTLMPVLLRESDGQFSAHGTMGGRAQPQIHTQLLLRRLDGESPEAAVLAPRFVVGGLDAGSESEVILAEPGLSAAARASLERSGIGVEEIGELDETVGHFQLATAIGGDLAVASDPRADGSGLVVTRDGDR